MCVTLFRVYVCIGRSCAVGDITTDGLLLGLYNGQFSFVINDTAVNAFCLRASFGIDVSIDYNQFYNISNNYTSKVSVVWGRGVIWG